MTPAPPTNPEALREALALALMQRLPLEDEIADDAAGYVMKRCVAPLLAQRDAALAERDEARRALERDRSTVAKVVNKMREALRGRSWLLEGGRGPYAWDDDRFREEFSAALDEIAAPLDVLLALFVALFATTPAAAGLRRQPLYSMEFEEIAVRAATCRPTRPIPNPCLRRRRRDQGLNR